MVRIGYVPYDNTFMRPGDRRRFVGYCRRREIAFEIADPREKYDLVILSERADITTWVDYPHDAAIVFDLIDAYLSIPRSDPRQLLRGAVHYARGRHARLRDYLSALRAMCRRADAVVCSTGAEAERIGQYCNNVRIILDIQTDAVTAKKTSAAIGHPLRMVWEGLPSNLHHLHKFKNLPDGCELHVITDLREPWHRKSPDWLLHHWEESTVAKICADCDIGIVPLDLCDPLAAGKSINKMLFYWRVGLPVWVTPTVEHCKAMALGREECLRIYSEENMLARWDQLFQSLGFDFGGQRAAVNRQYDHLGSGAGNSLGLGRTITESAAALARSDSHTGRGQ